MNLSFLRSIIVSRAVCSSTRMSTSMSMSSSSTAAAAQQFPVTASITENLQDTFAPQHLQVINESHMHNVPANSETHFKVVVVSEKFDSVKSPVARHRLINAALAAELQGPVHALSIVAKTPTQWETAIKEGKVMVPPSPSCRGGDGSLPPK